MTREAAVSKYFREMSDRYEQHKAAGGDVFNFEPERPPPDFNKSLDEDDDDRHHCHDDAPPAQ